MSTHAERLKALRQQLADRHLTGFVVPLADEHMSEYVGAYAQRLAWLTGFDGSAGSAVVLADKAALFVDGRYTLQASEQIDPRLYTTVKVPETDLADWLGENARAGDRIGYDPWLHSEAWVRTTSAKLEAAGAALVPCEDNPLDRIWEDQPARSDAKLVVHPVALAGRSSAEKLAELAAWLRSKRADVVVLTALDSIAWLMNVRGADVRHTPVALAFAIVDADGRAELFADPQKLTDEVRAHLGNAVTTRPRSAFVDGLDAQRGRTVAVDPATGAAAIFERLRAAGAALVEARDPCLLPKAIKNPVEIAGMRAAHLRDGAALTRFLHWLSIEAPKGGLDELGAAARLEAFRRETGELLDLSFDTISGAGPNGAIVHYRVNAETNRRIEPGQLYLVDSGAQYRDGTTDVTRTVAVGEPTAEMRDRFTRVLKGHIAIASAVFPQGTRGGALDALARRPLWEAGLDYAHGTGHGVGSYLAVHEGPQRIASAGSGFRGGDEALAPGMILSDEPGYYKAGAYGIRTENLLLVVERAIEGAEQQMLGFEPLTFAPIDLALVEPAMLTGVERCWLNDYHARVLAEVGARVEEPVRAWLAEATRPI